MALEKWLVITQIKGSWIHFLRDMETLGIKMVVIPEPCFKNSEGGYPQLFIVGIVPKPSSTRIGFDYGSGAT